MVIPIGSHYLFGVFVDTRYFPFGNFRVEGDDTLLGPDCECLHILAPLNKATLLLAG